MKKEILRMCVVCREMVPKSKLIRITIKDDDSEYHIGDEKVVGRGAYVCKNKECVSHCIKTKALNKAYKRNISEEIYKELKKVELNER